MADSVFGALTLGFNGQKSGLIDALLQRTIPQAIKNWGAKNLEDHRILTVDFFVKRKAFTHEQLSTLSVPLKLIHCTADIAYPLDHFEEFKSAVDDAGGQFSANYVEGAAHFGPVTHAPQSVPICALLLDASNALPGSTASSMTLSFLKHRKKYHPLLSTLSRHSMLVW